jgi:hypothetical protein
MFLTFKLGLDVLATVWATSPTIGQIFVRFSGHCAQRQNQLSQSTTYMRLKKSRSNKTFLD